MPIVGTGIDIAGQSIIFFGIGFFLAGLIGIACFPLVHNRAARLTTRRIEATIPSSMKDIQAEKDHLRAEFAMSARRLETSIEDLKHKTFAQKSALGEKAGMIHRLRIELDERGARILALEARESELEAREKSLFDQLRASKDDVTRMTDEVRAAVTAVDEITAEHRKLENAFEERSRLVENQHLEIVALRTQVESIRNQVYEMASGIKEGETRPIREWVDLRNAAVPRANGGEVNGELFKNAPRAGESHESGGAYMNGGAYKNGNGKALV